MTRWASIVATSRYHPDRLVTNDELRARFAALGKDEVIDRFEAGSGIRQRWYAAPDQATSDLACEAARAALDRAGLGADEVDLILVGTDTPDQITPATATFVQERLGAVQAGTFDVGCACASFPTALATAAGFIAGNNGVDTVLVIGAYLMERLADPNDPMVFFYGDGAGAAVVRATDEPGVLASALRADGRYARHWGIEAGGTREPASPEALAAGRTQVRLHERYPPEINEQGWPELVHEVVGRAGLAPDGVDRFIFTQVNRSTIEAVCGTLKVPLTRATMIMDTCGYTGSACVPMALDAAIERGEAGPGDDVVLVGSGVGYNMAAVALRLNEHLRRPPRRDGKDEA